MLNHRSIVTGARVPGVASKTGVGHSVESDRSANADRKCSAWQVGGWASRVANWAPRISGKLLDADGREALDFGEAEEGWFNVPVPDGQDGRLWKFQDTQGQQLLMTVPPFLARSAAKLLLPAEVVEADGKPR